jgi:hypothetical protein
MLPVDPSTMVDSADNTSIISDYHKLVDSIDPGDILVRVGGAQLNIDGLTPQPGPSIIIAHAKHLCVNP